MTALMLLAKSGMAPDIRRRIDAATLEYLAARAVEVKKILAGESVEGDALAIIARLLEDELVRSAVPQEFLHLPPRQQARAMLLAGWQIVNARY